MVHLNDNVSARFYSSMHFYFKLCLAFCSLRINLLDVNDNPPGEMEDSYFHVYLRLIPFSICYDKLELYNLSFYRWQFQ